MAKKLSSVLGVDIGSQTIKVCEIRTQGREPVITALGIAPTPEGAVDHTGVYNADAVGAALKAALSSAGAASSAAVISIAGQSSVLVRTLEVPKMNPQELAEHMQWEINRNIPFQESTVVSDFKPLGDDDPNSPNMDVVMAIAPQSAIDTMIACIKKAGRQMAAIDVEPLSLARSIESSYGDSLGDKTICVVEIGHTSTSINIYRGKKLVMPRQVPLGGELMTRAIADAMTVPMDEAQRLKHERCVIPETAGVMQVAADPFAASTQGFAAYNPFADDLGGGYVPAADPTMDNLSPVDPYAAPADPYAVADDPYAVPVEPGPVEPPLPVSTGLDPETERLYNAIAPVLEEFLGEVRRSIEYYMSQGGHVDVVEVCGGGAKLNGLVPFLNRALGIQCDAYDPLRRLNLNVRKVPSQFVDEHREEFAIAVGNGLHIFFD